jgi:hypothetical protein
MINMNHYRSVNFVDRIKMSIPESISTNKNLSRTIMNNNNLHQQQFLFDNLSNLFIIIK